MRKYTTLALFTFLSVVSFGQKNLLPGYLILPGKDTMHGLVDYRNWEKNPSKITFTRSAEAQEQIYSPTNIEGFAVEGHDLYRSALVTLDMNPVSVKDITPYQIDTLKKETVFLRVLSKGNHLNLYEFVDFKSHYFIQRGDGPIDELIYKIIMDPGTTNIETRNTFRGQLKYTLAAKPLNQDETKAIDKLDYKSKDLIKFVSALNGVQTNYVSDDIVKKKGSTKFFAGGGMVYNNFGINSEHRILNSLKFKGTSSFIFTAGVDFLSARNRQNLIMRAELSLSQLSAEGSGRSEAFTAGPREINEYSLKQINITPAASVIYNFIRFDKTTMYAGVTLGYNISTYPKHQLTTTIEQTGSKSTRDDFPELEKSWAAMYGRLGIIIASTFEVGLTGQFGGSFINYASIKETNKPISLRFSYRFK